jgi:leucyl-tRNA synthetase
MPQMLPVEKLPLLLPEVDKFLPTETGEPPLGHAIKWAWDTIKQEVTEVSQINNETIFPLELCTMPGFAGSSAYYYAIWIHIMTKLWLQKMLMNTGVT